MNKSATGPAAHNPGKPANQRGAARLAAVQALYQLDFGGAPSPSVVSEFEDHRLGQELEGEALIPADPGYFRNLVAGVVKHQRRIDPLIHETLPPDWPLKRIDPTLRAILRCGLFELLYKPDVPVRVIIAEYVDVARAFYQEDEPGLVNGVLDRLARAQRPAEFGD